MIFSTSDIVNSEVPMTGVVMEAAYTMETIAQSSARSPFFYSFLFSRFSLYTVLSSPSNAPASPGQLEVEFRSSVDSATGN